MRIPGRMAENDDEDGFGDFKFASSNGQVAVATEDDPDWGEFTKFRFNPAGSLPAENSNLFVNDSSATLSLSVHGLKPKGAIPLSFFGEEETEEAGSGVVGDSFETGMISGSKKVNGAKEGAPDLNHLISNLYAPNEKGKRGNGSFTGSALNNYPAFVDNQANSDLNGEIRTLAEVDVSLHESSDTSFRSEGSDSLWAGFRSISNGLVASVEALERKGKDKVSCLPPNGSGSNENGFVSKEPEYTMDHPSLEVDQDDDGWEFKDAVFIANQGEESKNKKDLTFSFSFPNPSWREPDSCGNELVSNSKCVIQKENGLSSTSVDRNEKLRDDDGWEFKAAESGIHQGYNSTKVEAMGWENPRGSGNLLGFIDNISPDLVSTSGQISGQPGEWDFGSGLLSSSPIENRAVDIETKSVSSPDDKNIKPGPDKTSSPSENESKDKENQTNERGYVEHKGALPLSIFGDEKLETDVPLDFPDVSTHKPACVKPDSKDPASNVSLSDIISSLYHQPEQSGLNHARNPIEDGHNENGFGPGDGPMVSNFVDDGSWEFKDAISEPTSQNQILQFSTESKINDLKDFYSKLKADLCLIIWSHLDSMKDLCEDQYSNLIVTQGNSSKGEPSNNFSIDIFLTALKEEKFQLLEAEYQLSDQLSQVEKDVKSAAGLLKHVISTLEILKLGSSEEQSIYVYTWGNILSSCVRELKHGAFIWKLSLQKNISSQMLSKPLGKQYMTALGEIFRVVKVLQCSVELYKPWVLCSSDSSRIFDLLDECFTLLSSSGIESALKTLSDPSNIEYDGTIKDLFQSIKNVHDLDRHQLYDQIFSGKQPTCHLSGLPLGKIPGMKVVVWDGEDYFLKLANLWANLISRDPPNLPKTLANR